MVQRPIDIHPRERLKYNDDEDVTEVDDRALLVRTLDEVLAMKIRLDRHLESDAEAKGAIARELSDLRRDVKRAVERVSDAEGQVVAIRDKVPSVHELESVEERVDRLEKTPLTTSIRVKEVATQIVEGHELEDLRDLQRLRRGLAYGVAGTVIAALVISVIYLVANAVARPRVHPELPPEVPELVH